MQWLKKTSLKQLILILASLSMLVTVFNMFYASAVVHRKSLMDSILQNNAGYADKLAQTIEVLLAQAQQELVFTAIMLGNRWHDQAAVDEQVETNSMLDLVLSGNPGSGEVINSKGVAMLAGYAYIPLVNWGLVAQSPTGAVLQKHYSVMRKVMLESVPVSVALLLAIWFCAGKISRPLGLLAFNAERLNQRKSMIDVKEVDAWFHEAEQLQKAMLLGLERMHDKVDQLQHDVDIDPLTGLNNRRVLAPQLAVWEHTKTDFCALMLDIDHFKKINDELGHAAGDSVLQELGHLVLDSSRGKDVSIRMGGEEFLILIDSCSLEVGERVAERLRCRVMEHEFKDVGRITISIGVATWPGGYASPEECVRRADEMLYRAKASGRNQVCSHRQCIS